MTTLKNCEGKDLHVWLQKKPSREARDKIFSKIKRIVKHEFGEDNVFTKGYPKYEIEATLPDGSACVAICKLGAYEDKPIWTDTALKTLGWSSEQAEANVRQFKY